MGGTTVTDDELIDEALAGRSAAFGQLVLKYQDRLFTALAHVIGCVEDARDAAQDAFVQAFVKLETFQHNSTFYTWLYRIAFNAAVSRSRKKRPHESLDGRREALGQEPVDHRHGGPNDGLERCERAAQVRHALDGLPHDYRAVIVLREIDGCDYEQISEILDVPVGTVRSRLHRARMQLKDQLKAVVT
jgi:RNA polymerase sigma-70 factor (ECF subfamily)